MKSGKLKIELIVALISVGAVVVFAIFVLSQAWLSAGTFIQMGLYSLQPDPSDPINTHGEFPFRFLYEIDGEQYSVEDTLICDYEGTSTNLRDGKVPIWNARLASGKELIETGEFYGFNITYSIELFDLMPKSSTSTVLDIGNPPYYLGYYIFPNYSPGHISETGYGVLKENVLKDEYGIKILEREFPPPMDGNNLQLTKEPDIERDMPNGVTVTPEKASYPPGIKQIVFVWENNSNNRLSCEQEFWIQEKIGNNWYNVYREMAVDFSREEIIMEPHTQFSYTYDISKYTDEIPSGHYRVVSRTTMFLKGNFGEMSFLCGEFIID